ncbi:cadherin-like protein 26 isoform X2 [Eleginops maclovinus]|uniref:cadherin-like protein 26 isoform X2 n=1 Tax=Eleginops maclovinus TaxID=56733 RepID=UPI003080AA51
MLCLFIMVFCFSSATCSELLSRHRRSWVIDSFTIEEEHPGPFPYVLGKINIERDYRVMFDLYGEGVEKEPKGVFTIDKDSGTLYAHRAVDYEKNKLLQLKFEAVKTDLSIDTKLGVEIAILDINDNPPRFQKDLFEISVDEDITQGSHIQTMVADDRDKRGTPNSTFHYEIKSVSPSRPGTEFTIDSHSGTISFKGCLDHELAEMFTVVVEAKDHGDVVSLSSSSTVIIHIQDGNNHLPTFSGQTGSGKVKEDETGTSPLRLHTTDKDTPNSPAWRAKYTIHGDEGAHFKIETDPDTNDGILTVVKSLDFEEEALRELTISVENEAPYFSCEVKEKTPSGLWKVDTSKGDDPPLDTLKVIIEVQDVNDPPVFSVSVKEVVLEENAPIGTWLEKITALDPDSGQARAFVYKVGSDPAGWVTVDPHTGDITTAGTPDRESPHVSDGVYTILLHAVDDGEPPMTGTATLNIHVTDHNDNVPQLTVGFVDVCVSDGPSSTKITAFDLDDTPFGGPFTFELLGDVKGKWKLNPSYGYTAGLVKEPGVYSGPHTIDVKISDMQGQFAVYNLSVTVCHCSERPNCRGPRSTATTAAPEALAIVFASLLLIMCLLLMAVIMTCRKEFKPFHPSGTSGETFLPSNIENPGTDCKVPDNVLVGFIENSIDQSNWGGQHDGIKHNNFSKEMEQYFIYNHFRDHRREDMFHLHYNRNQATLRSLVANGHHQTHLREEMDTMNFHATLHAVLHQLFSLQKKEGDLLEYEPQVYADEGDSDVLSELEIISLPDKDSYQKALNDLGPKFKQLASICKPPKIKN